MNMFGLQGIAETIYAFANDEIKDEVLPRFARGEVTVNGQVLRAGDALKATGEQAIGLEAGRDAEVLLFDLA